MPVPDYEFLIQSAASKREVVKIKQRLWNCNEFTDTQKNWLYWLLDEKLKLLKEKGA